MYGFLQSFLPRWLAEGLLILWYAALIALVLLLFDVAPGDFRYGHI